MSDPLVMPDGRPRCPVHGAPDCSPLLNGCSLPGQIAEHDAQIRSAMAEKLLAVINGTTWTPGDPYSYGLVAGMNKALGIVS